MLARVQARVVDLARNGCVDGVDQQRRLAAAGHARDAGEEPERDFRFDVLQVVCARTDDLQRLALLWRAALFGERDLSCA